MDADSPPCRPLLQRSTRQRRLCRRPSLTGAADRRTLIALGCGTFVAALVFVIPPLFFPQMATDLHVSVPLLGQIMSAMLALSVGLGLVIGPLADRSGYRSLILIGLVAAAVCLFVFGLTPTFLLLFLASAAGAMTDAGVLGPSLAIAGTAFTGPAARRAIGWTTAAQSGSAIVAVPLLAAIGAVSGWRTAFVVAGLAPSPSPSWQRAGCRTSIADPLSASAWTISWRRIVPCCEIARCAGCMGPPCSVPSAGSGW